MLTATETAAYESYRRAAAESQARLKARIAAARAAIGAVK